MNSPRLETLCIHAGQSPDPTTGAIMTPVYLTSTYAQASPGMHKGFEYSRTQNPTRFALQDCLAALEGGRHGLAFASGLAATDALLHLLDAGDHLVASDDVYGGTFRIFDKVFRRLGIEFTQVDMTDPGAVERALRPRTRMVWIESPTNPMLKLVDLAAVAGICRARGVLSVVDNTFATPCFQRPLSLGIDVVAHSTTKYLNGHSDVIGGAVVVNDGALADRIRFLQNAVGGVPSAMDSFLVLRGLKTLHVRMERHAENALQLARFLEGHPQVERVTYPGLPSHPQHALARRQMWHLDGGARKLVPPAPPLAPGQAPPPGAPAHLAGGPETPALPDPPLAIGGMLTFVIRGGLPAARAFLEAVRVFACAESLGGVESLIEHPAIMTHASVPKAAREALGIADGFIRVSAGIEAVEDLVEDLQRGFAAAAKAG